VWVACGKTSGASGTDSAAAGGDGGTAGNPSGGAGGGGGSGATGGVGGTSVGGGPVSTGDAVTTNSATTGSITTGSSTADGVGGSGGDSSCGGADHRLEGCYLVRPYPGGGGGGGAPPIDPCWDEAAPENCEATFEGKVSDVGAIVTHACGTPLFGGPTDLSDRGWPWLEISSEYNAMDLVIGHLEDTLDVEIGDTVSVKLVRQSYHAELMWGSRLTLTKNGELLAVLNDNLPIDGAIEFGDLTLSRGLEHCEQPEDSSSSCTYVAHDLDVRLADAGLGVAPDSRIHLGPYEILTEENFHMRDGGSCEDGDVSDFSIARVRP